MTAVISVCTLKKLIKIGIFCVAILILKMDGKKQHFPHIMLLLFKKGKNAPETHTQKICAVYGRIEYVRSDL